MSTYFDDFNGTVGNYLPTYNTNWVLVRGTNIIKIGPTTGNIQCDGTQSTSSVYEWRGLSTTSTDCEATIKLSSFNTSAQELQIILRSDGAGGNNHYRLRLLGTGGAGNKSMDIQKRLAGAVLTIGSPTADNIFGPTDQVTFRAKGTNLTAYVNGSLVLNVTDSSFSNGALGIAAFGTTVFNVDWWRGNDNYTNRRRYFFIN